MSTTQTTEAVASTDLLACPFCGEKPLEQGGLVICGNFKCSSVVEAPIYRWNTRPLMNEIADLLEEIAELDSGEQDCIARDAKQLLQKIRANAETLPQGGKGDS